MTDAAALQLTLCDEDGAAAARFGTAEFERLREVAIRYRKVAPSAESAARAMLEALERIVRVLEEGSRLA